MSTRKIQQDGLRSVTVFDHGRGFPKIVKYMLEFMGGGLLIIKSTKNRKT